MREKESKGECETQKVIDIFRSASPPSARVIVVSISYRIIKSKQQIILPLIL